MLGKTDGIALNNTFNSFYLTKQHLKEINKNLNNEKFDYRIPLKNLFYKAFAQKENIMLAYDFIGLSLYLIENNKFLHVLNFFANLPDKEQMFFYDLVKNANNSNKILFMINYYVLIFKLRGLIYFNRVINIILHQF